MSNTCEHTNPLIHQGTSQGERILAALNPENVELHGLSEKEWLEFAYEYARLINYFKPDNPGNPSGDWQAFFESARDVESLLNRYGQGDVEPHTALFISFLKLLTHPQKSLNELPKKHLDFYYRQVLKIREKPFQPDRVHVLFELAKNASDELIETGVPLNAGKDSDGQPMVFKTTTPLVLNHGKVSALKSAYVELKDDGTEILRHAPMANSQDGVEEELDDGDQWPAFGNPGWPEAELGFYIASDLLNMQEGNRTILLKFKLSGSLPISDSNIKAFYTGEDDWIEVSSIKKVSSTSYNFILEANILPDLEPVSAYDEEIHATNLITDKPVIKIIFTRSADYKTLKSVSINQLRLEVNVEDAQSLILKNELGNIDPEKPFLPFGSRPKIGSKLSVLYPEMAGKPVSNVQLRMHWLNTPAHFTIHYSHYEEAIREQKDALAAGSPLMGNYNVMVLLKDEETLKNESMYLRAMTFYKVFGATGPPPDEMKKTFTAQFQNPYKSGANEFELFSNVPQASVNTTGLTKKVADPRMSLILTESFYHDLYPKIYVNAVLGADDSADLPNEPYTPLLDQLLLNYSAYKNVDFTSTAGDHSSVMFHQHPFGTKLADNNSKKLVPDYEHGELYIGLDGARSGSNISLLFQVAEGSENPQSSHFEEGDIDWWMLADNEWQQIDGKDFARNQTNNFLQSGIVELAIPKNAGNHHSLFDGGLHWLRIRLKKPGDAVCRFINIHAQAAEAVFDDRENAKDHLNNGLHAETIGKMIYPRAQIKSVSQPYSGFGGEPAEPDRSYYRRVSERLRHKNRSVTIWDYEHLVLEQFPTLYKVKCLNHSRWQDNHLDQMSPGHVTLVLIPKISGDNTEFRLKPTVSRNFLDRVESFINRQSSRHAEVKTTNAIYEPVRFEFRIRFNPGLDFNFYKKQVMADLKNLMAPWIFEEDAAIDFGGSFTEYQVVNYLENLSYVDFLSEFRMYHKPHNGDYTRKTMVEPSIPMAILIPIFDEDKINEAERCA
jgi:hypothetical protein